MSRTEGGRPSGSARRARPNGDRGTAAGASGSRRLQVVERQPRAVEHLPRRRVAGARRQRLVAAAWRARCAGAACAGGCRAVLSSPRWARSSRSRSSRCALIFSSVEQGIEFEAVRGLQVARSLFLQQVQEVAAGAAALGDDPGLLRAQATAPDAARAAAGRAVAGDRRARCSR